ncbi:MAG: hypothetical protein HY064_01500 [Bacteroidetes bacterium]|nr:hypothetical protein [Bacteroidota bacterium]
MNSSELLNDYVKYNLWANKQLAGLLKTIDQTWIDKEVMSSFPSLRKTAFHIWDAEFVWLSRLSGTSPADFPSKKYSTEVHPAEFTNGSQEFLAFIEKQEENFFSAKTSFKTFDGTAYDTPNDQILMHIMNHSSFHRGQIVMMLRNLGFKGEMPRTDMIIYFRENVRQ